jgi:drug/metabolite transporter (DMT)-like permease
MAATILWSTTAIFIRYLTETYHLPPLILAFWRDLFVSTSLALAFVTFRPARLRVEQRHLRFLLLYGLVVSVFNSLWTISVALNGAAVSTVLAYSATAFTAVLGWWFLAEPLGVFKILAVVLSLLGCVFVSGAYNPNTWRVNPLGIAAGLISGLTFGVYSLMGKISAQRLIDPWTVLLYSFGFATLFLLGYNLIPGWLPEGVSASNLLWLGSSWVGWLILVALAAGPSVGGFGLYTVSLGYLPASVAQIIATLEPVMTSIWAFVLLSERFNGPQWLGSVLIIGGVVVLRLSEGH